MKMILLLFVLPLASAQSPSDQETECPQMTQIKCADDEERCPADKDENGCPKDVEVNMTIPRNWPDLAMEVAILRFFSKDKSQATMNIICRIDNPAPLQKP